MNKLNQLLAIVSGLTLSFAALSNPENPTKSATSGTTDMLYVGADNACDFSTIQAAVNSASNSQNPSEILIAHNQIYNDTLFLDHDNIILNGQFSDCAQARLGITTQERSTIQGQSNGAPTIHINGPNVTLKNLILTVNINGGILADATSGITLENMALSSLGPDASAIKVMGLGHVNLQIKDSSFLSNTAPQGAAINCLGSNHFIDVLGTSFTNNEAIGGSINKYGGAIFADGCDFSFNNSSFQNNRADFGGGVYLLSSDVVINTTIFNANIARLSSGAMVASNSTIDAEGVRFIDNQATMSLAGAIGLANSTLNLTKTTENCLNDAKCNYFHNNSAGFAGGAIGAGSGNINIAGAYFENNRSDSGSVLYLIESNLTHIEGSIFVGNGNGGDEDFLDQNVVFLEDDAIARITYSTFADNNTLLSTFNQSDNSQLSVYSSIIYDPNGAPVFNGGSVSQLNINCLITHISIDFNDFINNVTVTNPQFIDPLGGDYHISATSPAVDYCSDSLAMAQFTDIDNQARGFDDPTVPNNPNTNGTYDIGADEVHDLIFADGFE